MSTPAGEYSGPEVAEAVRILKEDALLAGQRAMAERMDRMEQRVGRMPVVEMTTEEKAAAYDKMLKEGKSPAAPEPPKEPEPPKPGSPTPPPPKPTDPEPKRRDPWWGEME